MKAISIVDAGATPPSSSCGFAICAIPIVRPVRRRREGRPFWARDFRQDRCLARLGSGARRDALFWAARPSWVWLSTGL
jgi:hypothetical protein